MDWYQALVKELKDSEFPTVLYGAGVYAQLVTKLLEGDGVTVNAYVVDSKYFSESCSLLGKKVYPLEKYVEQNKCNIIIAFLDCSIERENELRRMNHVNQVYTADFLPKSCLKDFTCGDYREFLETNKIVLEKLRNDLCDDVSKIHLDEYINQRVTGNVRKLHSNNLPYFDDDIVEISANETLVDCGAFDGDSILDFLSYLKGKSIPTYNKIIAFEADKLNVERMRENLRGLNNIEILAKGVSDHSGTLYFSEEGSVFSRISDNGIRIEVTTIDEVCNSENVTFIKMDIEGSELDALKGAEKTIKRCRPKLAICVYHKAEDLITIPQYIQSLHPDYKLFFRNYFAYGVDSMLYAL